MCTHDHGASRCLPIDALVSQVEDESGGAVKEAKDADAHEELGRRGEIALQKGFAFTAVTCQLKGVGIQPAGGDAHRQGG